MGLAIISLRHHSRKRSSTPSPIMAFAVARNGVPPDQRPGPKPPNPDEATEAPPLVGPHPGIVSVPAQYVFEQNIRQMQKAAGSDPNREDNNRLQGVQMIDNVRRALHLYVITFDPYTRSSLRGPRLTLLQPREDL